MITCAKVGALPSAKGENVCLGPSKLKKLIGRGSSSVSVYTCLMPVFLMAAMHAGLLGVADAASLRACSCDSRCLHVALSRRFVTSAVSHSSRQLDDFCQVRSWHRSCTPKEAALRPTMHFCSWLTLGCSNAMWQMILGRTLWVVISSSIFSFNSLISLAQA